MPLRGRFAAGFAWGAICACFLMALWVADGYRAQRELTSRATAATDARSAEVARLEAQLAEATAHRPSGAADGAEALWLAQAISSGKLTISSDIAQLVAIARGPADPNRSDVELVGPVTTGVLEERPILRVRPTSQARALTANLTDRDGNEVPLERVSPTSWRPSKPLVRGGTYRWSAEVAGDAAGLGSPVAAFYVVPSAALSRAVAARSRYKDSPLLLVVVYAREGLLDLADEALHKVRPTPGNTALVESLRADLGRARQR